MRLHVEAAGAGQPVVFLHGVSGSLRTYRWLPPEITDGRRIVLVDLRGHGSSPHAPDGYGIDAYAADVADVLRGLDAPAVLAGHSLGGVVAWTVAQRWPELVRAAFLEDPPLYRGDPEEHAVNAALPAFEASLAAARAWREAGASEEAVAAELAAAPYGPNGSLTVAEAQCDDVPAARAFALLHMDFGVLEGVMSLDTLGGTDTSSPVAVPVLLVAADEATRPAFSEAHGERLAASHPDVEIRRVAGAAHGIHDEREHRADYVRALAGFLAVHA